MSAETVRLCNEIEALREALRTVATNMRALEDGGCDYPRVIESYRVAFSALAARTDTGGQG